MENCYFELLGRMIEGFAERTFTPDDISLIKYCASIACEYMRNHDQPPKEILPNNGQSFIDKNGAIRPMSELSMPAPQQPKHDTRRGGGW